MPLLGDDRRNQEIRRFPILAYALVPLAALVLQAWLPRVMGRFAWFDLPLVVTVYFALDRRSPIQGTLMGAAMGLFEDAFSNHAALLFLCRGSCLAWNWNGAGIRRSSQPLATR
jgi:rod shape-determining protein MreD